VIALCTIILLDNKIENVFSGSYRANIVTNILLKEQQNIKTIIVCVGVHFSTRDADVPIVQISVGYTKTVPVFVVGEDTYLLVLLFSHTALCNQNILLQVRHIKKESRMEHQETESGFRSSTLFSSSICPCFKWKGYHFKTI